MRKLPSRPSPESVTGVMIEGIGFACFDTPPQMQGYRIWKIQSRIRDLAARGVRLPPPRLGIGLRTDRNRNTNCDCARLAHAVPDSFWRASFFHMRFPCPLWGRDREGGGPACRIRQPPR